MCTGSTTGTCHPGQVMACLLQSFKGGSLGGFPWCQLPNRSPSPAAEGQLPVPGTLLSSSALVTYLTCLREWKVLCKAVSKSTRVFPASEFIFCVLILLRSQPRPSTTAAAGISVSSHGLHCLISADVGA